MTRFKVLVIETNGAWFFRWDNVSHGMGIGTLGPYSSKEEAEAARQGFMDDEKTKCRRVGVEFDLGGEALRIV